MMGYFMDGMGWWMIWGSLFSLLFIVAAVALGAWVVKTIFHGMGSSPPSRPSALDILKARYAQGELSQEEYERMKKELL